ncbi:MAG: hypothetical protein FJ318_05850 [SAR202 cluster bacterium]|nr:hypothetical protein [SAR202 cluster bacterium]
MPPSDRSSTDPISAAASAIHDAASNSTTEVRVLWHQLSGGRPFSNEAILTVHVELAWYLIAAMHREALAKRGMDSAAWQPVRDRLIADTARALADALFDWSGQPPEVRQRQGEVFVEWCSEAEADYGDVMKAVPTPGDVDLEDNLAGRWAMRVIGLADLPKNFGLTVQLSLAATRCYGAAHVPRTVTDLTQGA